jgi:hypothetical protein
MVGAMETAARPLVVTLQCFVGCATWRATYDVLRQALNDEGHEDVDITVDLVETPEDAQRLRFTGSPTILIDGRDPFAPVLVPTFGLKCRVYVTPDGLADAPSTEQIRQALRAGRG